MFSSSPVEAHVNESLYSGSGRRRHWSVDWPHSPRLSGWSQVSASHWWSWWCMTVLMNNTINPSINHRWSKIDSLGSSWNNQSKISFALCQPIREEYCIVSTNEKREFTCRCKILTESQSSCLQLFSSIHLVIIQAVVKIKSEYSPRAEINHQTISNLSSQNIAHSRALQKTDLSFNLPSFTSPRLSSSANTIIERKLSHNRVD